MSIATLGDFRWSCTRHSAIGRQRQRNSASMFVVPWLAQESNTYSPPSTCPAQPARAGDDGASTAAGACEWIKFSAQAICARNKGIEDQGVAKGNAAATSSVHRAARSVKSRVASSNRVSNCSKEDQVNRLVGKQCVSNIKLLEGYL